MANQNIIGRGDEIKALEKCYKSHKSEFIAIYGRRRVGKSFLVNEYFKGKLTFSIVGTFIKDNTTYKETQLTHFRDRLIEVGMSENTPVPTSWREAFNLLKKYMLSLKGERIVMFFDELPWLAGPQSSELIAELGYFWNSWADQQRNIVLIVCGSATSWMLDNVIRDYGSLHGRLTKTINLKPFTLKECEAYYKKNHFNFSRYEMAIAYMALGGIPYYLDKLDNTKTLTENIDDLFFNDSRISQEFKEVYTGLYSTSERYIDVVKVLGEHFYGLTRTEIAKLIGIESGGSLSKIIDNLKVSGIIRDYPRYGKSRMETVYQLKDFFSHFFLHFIGDKKKVTDNWRSLQHSPSFYAWAGQMFEMLCTEHLPQMKETLRIHTINRNYCWAGQAPDGTGAQIDLVLEWDGERTDYLCEMKFSENAYTIDNKYEMVLRNKLDAFLHSKQHKQSHSVQLIMITSMGLTQNTHASLIQQSIKLDDLFA